MSVLYELRSVECRRGSKPAITGITADVKAGEFVCICGLNGAGKSTLIEVMAGILRHYSGSCRFENRDLHSWKPRALAQRISYLPQASQSTPPLPVEEVVLMGRNPFRDRWHESPKDHAISEDAMQKADCTYLKGRMFDQLSGGERQRVLFAATLAQQPAALLLDEPGTFVDLPHQVRMFRTIRDLCRGGLMCLAATHDLNLAASYASRILFLDGGRLLLDATPGEVLSSPRLVDVLGADVRFERAPDGRPRLHYVE
jgi:iron complex transport system ATP-binding protein